MAAIRIQHGIRTQNKKLIDILESVRNADERDWRGHSGCKVLSLKDRFHVQCYKACRHVSPYDKVGDPYSQHPEQSLSHCC